MRVDSDGKFDHDAIYDKYFKDVYQVAKYYSGNHHAAEEIAQNTFMKLLVNEKTVNTNSVLNWLQTVAKYDALNYNRSLKHEVLTGDIAEECDKIECADSVEDDYLKQLREKECRNLKDNILTDLESKNEKWHVAVMDTYEKEKPQKDVAKEMGVTLGVLQARLKRARKWIKKEYKEKFDNLDKA